MRLTDVQSQLDLQNSKLISLQVQLDASTTKQVVNDLLVSASIQAADHTELLQQHVDLCQEHFTRRQEFNKLKQQMTEQPLAELCREDIPISKRLKTSYWEIENSENTIFDYTVPPNVSQAVVVLPPASQVLWVLAKRRQQIANSIRLRSA